MSRPAFDALLAAARATHAATPALHDFCPFPADLVAGEVAPSSIPAAEVMNADAGLRATGLHPLARAFVDAAPQAQWRETYKDTDIGADFLDRFGCYCLIGEGGPWQSAGFASYMVYMPPGLDYPRHHHPAEELYLVLYGAAEFRRDGMATERLGPGGHVIHASNQPHAMATFDSPVMAYVCWRNHLATGPVLTADAEAPA